MKCDVCQEPNPNTRARLTAVENKKESQNYMLRKNWVEMNILIQSLFDTRCIKAHGRLTDFWSMFHLRINQWLGFTSKMFEKHLQKSDILSKDADQISS